MSLAGLKKREKFLVAVTGASLLVFLVSQFVCTGEKGARKRPPVATRAAGRVPAPAQVAEPSSAGSDSTFFRRTPLRLASWKRDPFAEAYRLATPDTTRRDTTGLTLKGIIWQGGEALALIGDAILREGQRSGDLRVLDIAGDHVLCKRGKKVVTLSLGKD